MNRAQLEADLVTYYDSEAAERTVRALPPEREAARSSYADLLGRENRASVLEIGSGPGRDGVALRDTGLRYTGVDLAPESVALCRQEGLDVHVASVHELPFEDDAFEAGWTMSTLLHVPDTDLDSALGEIVRVLRPGAPLAVGVWGAAQSREETWDEGTGFGPRFFSLRSDADLREQLASYGEIEEFRTWPGHGGLHYQWAVLRCR
ncbi:class I SAM-dependent methyltransferase [Luteipulveratus mongoliensis]|uniref:Methyltransferase type 11 domain-containing protein n=1 Tax=Luteipulveratus mongoliensis TaxID=571913 RepID=A0A0K1JJJ3_9MICO|nr:class I SAM-dependent methyltransferase [Luteipulveratus mongoliensis]AKU16748.1 hypothetical protein VV02_14185 [Luteipulveratus mongoliensis]